MDKRKIKKNITKKVSVKTVAEKINNSQVKVMPKPVKRTEKNRTKKVSKKEVDSAVKLSVTDDTGDQKEKVNLPREFFKTKYNGSLVTQAVHVYSINQRQYNASTKTRGEVSATTKKVYKQKGTGNARHGSKKAPIYVGGGVAFGPKPKIQKLRLSKTMRNKALFSVLSQYYDQNKIKVLTGIELDKPSTKKIFRLVSDQNGIKKTYFLFGSKEKNISLSIRNINNIQHDVATNINIYQVLNHDLVMFTKEGFNEFADKYKEKV